MIFTFYVFWRWNGLPSPPWEGGGGFEHVTLLNIEMSHSSSFTELHQVSKVLSHILK